ncbi:MAG TPA: lysylphosphatidylglycerol synthase transmembrane domain-containing protein [Candidatus Polarisedimenticolia bacterium]
MKPVLRIVLSLILTGLFLVLFFNGFDLGAAWRSASAADPTLLALGVLVNLAAYVVRAWRWRYLLAPIKEGVGLYNLTSTTLIGFMISFLVPFRVGEVVRPVVLARREGLHAGAAFATVALERLLDTLTVMSLFLVFVLLPRGAAILSGGGANGAVLFLKRGAVAAAGFVLLGLPLVILLVAMPDRIIALLHRLNPGRPEGAIGRAIAALRNLVRGFGAIRRVRDLAPALLLSCAVWLLIDLSVFCTVRAFDLPLRFTDTFLLLVPLGVGIAVPTPGGVGPYEYLGQISLVGFWGVGAARAAAAAVTLHASTLVPTIAAGLFFMWRDGVRPSEVRKIAAMAPAGSGGQGAS